MTRLARAEVFSPDEVAIVHVMNRVVRRCFLLGDDSITGKNYDHRKVWIEDLFEHFAACFGIDLLCFAILSNHFHLVLRSRPDVVESWDDEQVARRWMLLCPTRKRKDGTPEEPSRLEIKAIMHDAARVAEIRRRLSDISWWMRLLCQRIGTRANREDGESGKFWQSRFQAVRILDDEALLACAAYVDLNPIRAAMSETLEASDFTSAQRRIESLHRTVTADAFLSPILLTELMSSELRPPANGRRCSDHGFLPITLVDYLELLDWTARQAVTGKAGATPAEVPPILDRLSIDAARWCELVSNFGDLFYHVAGKPRTVDDHRTSVSRRRFHLRAAARKLFSTSA
jgi:hypothetical protein